MNVTFEKRGELEATVKIHITPEDYKPRVDAELKKVSKKVVVPGFRPGQAPAGMIKKQYGKSVLVDEVNKMASEQLFEYLRQNDLSYLAQPLFSKETESQIDFEKEADFLFAFDLGLAPKFDLNITKNDKVTRYKITVDDSLVEEEISSLKKKFANQIDAESIGDKEVFYAIATELDENGKALESGVAEKKISLSLDSIKDADIKAQFEGKKVGDVINADIKKIFDNNETVIASALSIPKEGVADLYSNFEFKIDEIKTFVDAEINQALFDQVFGPGKVNSEEEFRAKLVEGITSFYTREAENQLEHTLSHLITDNHKFELPAGFLKRWLMENNPEKINDENVDKTFEGEAGYLKFSLIRDKFAKEHNLEVSRELVEDASLSYTADLFRQYGMDNAAYDLVKKLSDDYMKKEEHVNRMTEMALNNVMIQKMKELVDIIETEINVKDFYSMIEEHNKMHAHNHEHDHDHE